MLCTNLIKNGPQKKPVGQFHDLSYHKRMFFIIIFIKFLKKNGQVIYIFSFQENKSGGSI